MKLTLKDKSKIDILVALFQLLKNCSCVVKLEFYDNKLIIQGMDKSHVCLFYNDIKSEWFDSFIFKEEIQITIDSSSILTILSRILDNQILIIEYKSSESNFLDIEVIINEDMNNIDNKNKNKKVEYNRYFQIPIIDIEQENFNITNIDYDAEFSINSKQFSDLVTQLNLFGDILNITCNESEINLESNGDSGIMKVAICIDDLNEFSISEGENLELSFSLNYIAKMCISTKLSNDVEISIGNDYPIKIKYDLGINSYTTFYVAPKIIN